MNHNVDEFNEMPMTEETEQASGKEKKKIIIIAVLVLAVLYVTGYCLYGMMLRYTAHSRYETLRADAQRIYQTAEMWLEEGNTLTTRKCNLKKQDDEFSVYLSQYFGKQNGWYVMICDADGNPEYVLYSREKISDKRMDRPDRDEEIKRLRSPLWSTYAIGCYPEE